MTTVSEDIPSVERVLIDGIEQGVISVLQIVVVGGFMGVEAAYELALWQHLAMWLPITILGSLALLQPIKGAVVGLQWANYMHGFGGEKDVIESHPES